MNRLALTSGQTSGHCSPFSRRQFPRDSGCYDAHKNSTRRTISPDNADKLTRENNLDTGISNIVKCSSTSNPNNGIINETKDDYHPNIPISGTVPKEGQFDKSPQLRSAAAAAAVATATNVRFIAKRRNFGDTVVIGGDEINSINNKIGITKYGITGNNDIGISCDAVNNTVGCLSQQRGGCLSEKSSDSGVSSSSISSTPIPRDKNIANNTAIVDSPTKTFTNFSRASPTNSQNSNSKGQNDASYQ